MSNTYTSQTQHVHVFANALKKQNNIAHFRNLKGATTRVCVVYMLDKHIHALNLLGINTITNIFMGRVRVWHLSLKKNTLYEDYYYERHEIVLKHHIH